MNKKRIKERLKKGEIVFGTWNGIPSTALLNAIGLSGIDFVIIDAEHGPVNIQNAEDLVRALDVTDTDSIIRVPANLSHLILRALDIGASGVQIPHVSTEEEAVKAVKYAKYYPLGERGFTPFTRAGKYGQDAEGYAEKMNEQSLVVVNVEGCRGMKNLEKIASVPGIDVIFIGPYDLSQSLGRPGEVEDAEVIENIKKGVVISEKNEIACGSYARDMRYLNVLMECGVRYLTYMVDSAVILNAYKDVYNGFMKIKTGRGSNG
ncbi:MAG: aldolase/citrate lyase family protein [Candidatus Omnitrophota bacterium]